jgi:hypothetical protein
MSNFATLPAKERELFFRQYQEKRGVDPVIAEKDFWVCWLLGRIFAQPQLADACVFKGGTSLSKVFGAIERFSEDIDLAIIPASLGWKESDLDQAPSRTKREERMAELEAACAAAVQATWQPLLEESVRTALGAPAGRDTWLTYRFDEAGRSPVLYFAYPGALPRGVAYIAREVKIEFGSLTDQRPVGRHPIQAFVAELAPGAFADFDAEVVALELERTFWEKATILHAEAHRAEDKATPVRLSRHYADLVALAEHAAASAALGRDDLRERVVAHKRVFFASTWASYETAVPGTFRLVPPAVRLAALEKDYRDMREMYFGEPKPWPDIVARLRDVEGRINARVGR